MKNGKSGMIAALMLLTGNWMQVNAQTWECSQATYNSTSKGYEHNGITYFRKNNGGEANNINDNLNQGDCHGSTKSIPMDGSKFFIVCDIDIIGFKVYGNSGTGGSRTCNGLKSGETLSTATTSVSDAVFSGSLTGKATDVSCAPDFISVTGIEMPAGTYLEVAFSGNAYVSAIELIPAETCTPATASFASGETTKTLGDAKFTNTFTSNNSSAAVYASSNKAVATVDAGTGEVSILAVGETTISVAQAADDTYCAVEKSYVLTVEAPTTVYTVTPSSGDTDLGTVSLEDDGVTITAVPATCSEYADPAYTVLDGTATVYQNENTFTVVASSDCEIRINFVAKPVYTVTLDPGSGRIADETSSLTQIDCTTPVALPAAVSCANDRVFAGWYGSAVSETTAEHDLIPAGNYMPEDDITLYAVYSITETSDTENVLFDEQFTNQTATTGSSNSNETYDESWTRGTGSLYFTETNAITLRSNVKYSTSPIDLRNPETIIEFRAKYEAGYTPASGNVSAICVNDNASTNNGFQFAVQSDNTIAFKSVNVIGDPELLSEAPLTDEFQTFKVKINGSYVGGDKGDPLDGSDHISIRVQSTGGIPLVIGSFKVYAFISETTYNSNPACSDCTPAAPGAFAEASVSKTLGDEPFTNTFTEGGENTSPVVYSSSNTETATVDASTGEVTIAAVGSTTITAMQAEDNTYCETSASYTLTVAAPVYDVQATANNNEYGTVSVTDYVITALPLNGYQIADPGYQITAGDPATTVSKKGRDFTVTPNGNVTLQINFEPLPLPLSWNFSDTQFEVKTYNEATTVDGLNIGPGNIVVDQSDKNLDGYNFTHRLKLPGTGSATNRFVSFDVRGSSEITIYGMSGSSTAGNRTLNVFDGTSVIGTLVNDGTALGKGVVYHDGGASTIYLYSANSGFNIYAIRVDGLTGLDSKTLVPLRVYTHNQSIAVKSNASDLIEQISVYDIQGRPVYDRQVKAASHIVDKRIPSGAYIVKVSTESTVQSFKVFK